MSAKHYLATSYFGWGKGDTIAKAVHNCIESGPLGGKHRRRVKPDTVTVFLSSKEVTMFADGTWEYLKGHRPKIVGTIVYSRPAIQMERLEAHAKAIAPFVEAGVK